MKPKTLYAKSGSINIAYQVFGSGPIDLVYIPGWVSNIDLMWACPSLAEFLKELAKNCRVILFDKRGTGLSDRITELSTLEDRMDDIRAVMDAVGSEKSVLFGHSEGGSVSALFAATFPHRTISLITFGIFAKRRYSKDYPWAPTDEERQKIYDMIENSWGSGEMNLESLAPSRANDPEFMDWLAQYFRSGASPSAAMVLTKMNTLVDIVNILDTIRVPTLMIQRKHDIDVKIEEGRFISKRIKNSTFVELEGSDHLFWAGNSQEILDIMKSFILKAEQNDSSDEKLTCFLVAKVLDKKDGIMVLPKSCEAIIGKFKGVAIHQKENVLIATFEGPSKAVHCGLALMELMKQNGKTLATSIHMMEASIRGSIWQDQKTKIWIHEMLDQALPNQILISETVKNLLSGAGLNILSTLYSLRPEGYQSQSLYKVNDHITSKTSSENENSTPKSWNESFLEDVIQCIDANLDNELFSLETLSREMAVSERQLQRKLKAISNKSPNQLISSVRLHRAKELLHTQKYGVSEIAFQTGFSNLSYFSKCFKREFGISPSTLISQF
ncbi:alpha/beta fold hydrolase [Algoriphagus zhangzhouensis]|uniref:Pimeloyl-ACP methyl ester carboxylesterase n=1 Tax=Algoriphagus zhangzhouensis TaxID=1073327 RepID=A0A1M7ZG59_9BACT|nr:alpha/beta fold hydrolase [Algoriphagus zhangzhouensis]TDY44845.1 pimeloyl-ACP methyl ester carboxylesterase [Algoriphagus zhangzhouensis]SHO63863.1 Pimeloyl-ACP methyl ester carboxylesterase [Algoriphagus zhangzhouensis]